MNILSEVNKPCPLSSITAKVGISHFWTLSSQIRDFKLEELTYLEEMSGKLVTLQIGDTIVKLPSNWSIMIVDNETYTIDLVKVPNLAAFDYDVFLFSPEDSKLKTTKVKVIGLDEEGVEVVPSIPKGSAMIVPAGTFSSHGRLLYCGIVTTPYDLWRWLNGCTVGDLLT